MANMAFLTLAVVTFLTLQLKPVSCTEQLKECWAKEVDPADVESCPGFWAKPGTGPQPGRNYCLKDVQCIKKEGVKWVAAMIKKGQDKTAMFLRIVFHDCAGGSCDGSLLLSDTELDHPTSINMHGLYELNELRAHIKSKCGQLISWADAPILAAAAGVAQLGGPNVVKDLYLGRKDSTKAENLDRLPGPGYSSEDLVAFYSQIFRVSPKDAVYYLVTLSGAHTLGSVMCPSIFPRLAGKPDNNMDSNYHQEVSDRCTEDCNNRQWLDVYTPEKFDNLYYRVLLDNKGILASDQVIYSRPLYNSDKLVAWFAENEKDFFEAFAYCFLRLTMLGGSTSTRRIDLQGNEATLR